MYLIPQLTYSQFLVLLNKVIISNLEVIDMNNQQIVAIGKKEAGLYHLNSFNSHYDPQILIDKSFTEVMPW